jgi:hypothetical protein
MTSELHASAAFPAEEIPVPTRQEDGWTPIAGLDVVVRRKIGEKYNEYKRSKSQKSQFPGRLSYGNKSFKRAMLGKQKYYNVEQKILTHFITKKMHPTSLLSKPHF